ncbi:hypothetical protein LTSEMIS_3967 [Salmonella enterica subsp. enterica serovar Mississippi str. A4-633]|nr:hypothetical protein LTSEMIS_3967 [Salmonella enterica subsp. enterica serovar Mississippi str. A4-633]
MVHQAWRLLPHASSRRSDILAAASSRRSDILAILAAR